MKKSIILILYLSISLFASYTNSSFVLFDLDNNRHIAEFGKGCRIALEKYPKYSKYYSVTINCFIKANEFKSLCIEKDSGIVLNSNLHLFQDSICKNDIGFILKGYYFGSLLIYNPVGNGITSEILNNHHEYYLHIQLFGKILKTTVVDTNIFATYLSDIISNGRLLGTKYDVIWPELDSIFFETLSPWHIRNSIEVAILWGEGFVNRPYCGLLCIYNNKVCGIWTTVNYSQKNAEKFEGGYLYSISQNSVDECNLKENIRKELLELKENGASVADLIQKLPKNAR